MNPMIPRPFPRITRISNDNAPLQEIQEIPIDIVQIHNDAISRNNSDN